jgi:chemotaxis protein MotA
MHAMILVCGGTVAIAFLSYSTERLIEVFNFVFFGFLFRFKKTESTLARDLISFIDHRFRRPPSFEIRGTVHPFIVESFKLLDRHDLDFKQTKKTLLDRRNAVKRRYTEDAKILNNIAKYPPHLGLLGAASGMIEMMTMLGKTGVDGIGGAMAIALSATLWGIGLNNFVFLPLSDNSMKSAEDEIYLRDVILECALMIKRNEDYDAVIRTVIGRLALSDRAGVQKEYQAIQDQIRNSDAA